MYDIVHKELSKWVIRKGGKLLFGPELLDRWMSAWALMESVDLVIFSICHVDQIIDVSDEFALNCFGD